MSTLVLWLALVAPPTETNSPLPIGSNRPETGGLHVVGGSSVGTGAASSWGYGWEFADGSLIEIASNGTTYRRAYFETETYRIMLFAGSSLGACQEWYLGKGLVASLDLGIGANTAALIWYPTESFRLSLQLDPLRGRLGWGWRLIL